MSFRAALPIVTFTMIYFLGCTISSPALEGRSCPCIEGFECVAQVCVRTDAAGAAPNDAGSNDAGLNGEASDGETTSSVCPPQAVFCCDFEAGDDCGWTLRESTLSNDAPSRDSNVLSIPAGSSASRPLDSETAGWITLWTRAPVDVTNRVNVIVLSGASAETQDFIFVGFSHFTSPERNVYAYERGLSDGTTSVLAFSERIPVNLDGWHCVEMHFDGSTDALYLNGEELLSNNDPYDFVAEQLTLRGFGSDDSDQPLLVDDVVFSTDRVGCDSIRSR